MFGKMPKWNSFLNCFEINTCFPICYNVSFFRNVPAGTSRERGHRRRAQRSCGYEHGRRSEARSRNGIYMHTIGFDSIDGDKCFWVLTVERFFKKSVICLARQSECQWEEKFRIQTSSRLRWWKSRCSLWKSWPTLKQSLKEDIHRFITFFFFFYYFVYLFLM